MSIFGHNGIVINTWQVLGKDTSSISKACSDYLSTDWYLLVEACQIPGGPVKQVP